MFSYTQKNIYVISLIISIILFISLNYLFTNINKINFNFGIIPMQTQENINKNNIEEANWRIEIPQINLKAEISEGTTEEIMNKYVGHFEETSKTNGNIGLVAHNEGYQVNYFENIKKLKKGEQIIYKCGDFEKIYIIDTIEIIKDTDWSYLEETEENRITLITCIEDEPEYRRCIQGVEKLQFD